MISPVMHCPPFKIKMVEPIRLRPPEIRYKRMKEAWYNVFNLRSQDVFIDLLTDSGTGAMSDRQWSALMLGDEAYAGSESFEVLHAAVESVTGYSYVIPVHQGRGAERVFFETLVHPGDIVPSNTHFDTTAANLRRVGAIPLDLPTPESFDLDSFDPFKGNMDLERLEELLKSDKRKHVPFIMMTLTNNAAGGHPASLGHMAHLRELADRYDLRLFIDAARFAENAWFIKSRETSQNTRTIIDIARDVFKYADGCLMSAKKDAIVPIGGFIAVRDKDLYKKLIPAAVAYEGFLTYGGLAGHDLGSLGVGLQEVLQEDYLAYRISQVAKFHDQLAKHDIPVVNPPGGHAVYIIAERLMPHIPADEFPGQALSVAFYLTGGVRTVEIGSLMLAHPDSESRRTIHPAHELVRLSIPRRVYTDEHLEYVVDIATRIASNPSAWPGFRIVEAPADLRHFLAKLEPKGSLPPLASSSF